MKCIKFLEKNQRIGTEYNAFVKVLIIIMSSNLSCISLLNLNISSHGTL